MTAESGPTFRNARFRHVPAVTVFNLHKTRADDTARQIRKTWPVPRSDGLHRHSGKERAEYAIKRKICISAGYGLYLSPPPQASAV